MKGWWRHPVEHGLAARGISTSAYVHKFSKHQPEPFAQPTRSQPGPDILGKKDLLSYLAHVTHQDIQRWGGHLIADVKYRGIRGLIIIDPKKGIVKVFSRNLKPLAKFQSKYHSQLLEDLSSMVKDTTVLDTELYAVDGKGNPVPQQDVTGFIKNPSDPKYAHMKALVEAFDILLLNDKDLEKLPLEQRKKLLQKSLDYEAGLIQEAEFREIPNKEAAIRKELSRVTSKGGEGLVLKKPSSQYFHGKNPKNPWKKVKLSDTIDLRLREVEAYPTDKPFWFYKHWILSPEDAPDHEIPTDKGIQGADFDHAYYVKYTKKLLDQFEQGKIKGTGQVQVAPKYQKLYGRKTVPKSLKLKNGPIVEVFTEDMSRNLQPSGHKIVGIRTDKKKADNMKSLKNIFNLFYRRGK